MKIKEALAALDRSGDKNQEYQIELLESILDKELKNPHCGTPVMPVATKILYHN